MWSVATVSREPISHFTTIVLRTCKIASRASDYGAGSGLEAVVLLTSLLRWTSLAPNVFYTQMLLASMTCVAQSSPKGIHDGSFFMWRTFVLGRVRCLVLRINAAVLSSGVQLPRLLQTFETGLEGHGTVEADWVCYYCFRGYHHLIFLQRAAMHAAVSTVLQRSDLLSRCDHVQAQARTRESSEEETTGWVSPLPCDRPLIRVSAQAHSSEISYSSYTQLDS